MTVERRFETGAREDPSDAPGLVLGDDGITYLVAPDGTRTAVGAGGSVTSRAVYAGNSVTIADGASAPLPINTKQLGDDLLDLSTPTAPTAVAAGTYAVTLVVWVTDAMTIGGNYATSLELDTDNDDPSADVIASPPATAGQTSPVMTISMTYFIPAGGKVFVAVENHDGAASRPYAVQKLIVQRLT